MNTITASTSTATSWRAKYFSSNMQSVLRKALVCEKICSVDNTELKYIDNPYGGQPTATIQAVVGTYSVSSFTLTDDRLTVTDEVIYAEHVYSFESIMANYDLMATRMDEMAYAVAYGIDYFVLNNLTTAATGSVTTPAGGFTQSSNIPKIMGDLVGTVAGFADTYKGLFLVIENTDVTGFIQAQVASGFSYADAALNNGFLTHYAGVDIYVVRSGTFVTATVGSTSVTNSGCRVFGVKNVSTYAAPRGLQYDEKSIGGSTGKEICVSGLVGFKLWAQKAGLVVKITLA